MGSGITDTPKPSVSLLDALRASIRSHVHANPDETVFEVPDLPEPQSVLPELQRAMASARELDRVILDLVDAMKRRHNNMKDTLTHIALETHESLTVEDLRGWAMATLKEEFPQDFDPDYKDSGP